LKKDFDFWKKNRFLRRKKIRIFFGYVPQKYSSLKECQPIRSSNWPAIADINIYERKSLSIYKFGLSVCLFVSDKRQNGWTDRAKIFCGTSRDPREGLWMIKISNICLHQNSIFIKLLTIFYLKGLLAKITRFRMNPNQIRIIYIFYFLLMDATG